MIININGASVTSVAFISVEREDAAKGPGGVRVLEKERGWASRGSVFGRTQTQGGLECRLFDRRCRC